MRNAGYFRTPTVAGDTVVFVSEDDLWSVPLSGGIARRITVGLGAVAAPSLSRDGRLLAFSGQDEFHLEVFVMDARGGEPRRLTFLGATSTVCGWTADGEIVFSTDAGRPFVRWTELHAVHPETGAVRRLPFGPATEVSFGPKGAVVLGRHTQDLARWKRYRGGRTGDLWVDARGKGTFRRLITLDGNLAHPIWVGRRIAFVADHDGIGNLYSCTPSGKDLRRHTDHDEYYARFASGDADTVVYQHAAELWALDVDADRARRIEVDFPSPRTQRRRKFVDGARSLQGFDVHPDGHSVAIEARGRVITMPLWEGPVRAYGAPDGVRYRLGSWLHERDRVVMLSDESGDERLEVHRPDGKRKRFEKLDLGVVHELVPSPSANLLAVANHRLELLLVDLDAGTASVVDRSAYGRAVDIAWSPDGAWIAYSHAGSVQTRSIKLCEVGTGETHEVTPPAFRDVAPVFDPTGRYLYFVSYRIFDPVPDVHFFQLGFPRGGKPFVVSLRADAPSPLRRRRKGLGKDDDDGPRGSERGAPTVTVELDGLPDRIAAIPVPEARYAQLAAIEGKLVLLSFPVRGMLGTDDEGGAVTGRLEAYDFEEQKHETLLRGVKSFVLARDGATLIARTSKGLRALRAGKKPEEGTEKEGPGPKSGKLDLSRVRISVDPGAEWRQMYLETWRLQRENFWTQDLSGVDWALVRDRYRPLVDKVATRGEFSDLIWEMQGELGTSHSYELGGDHRKPPAYKMGHLGTDLSFDPGTGLWRIERIVRGDPWDEDASSPLRAMGVGVAEGDTILAINGQPVAGHPHPNALLVNLAGQRVELRLGDPNGKKPRTVEVKTLASETRARYRDWVEANRARVHRATRGRVGYVHVPDMGATGFAEFHRSYLSELDRDALIIDVRYNRGGFASQTMIEKLIRRRIGYVVPRWGAPEPYPTDSVLGPIVALANENAGSDGDVFTHAFKMYGIGPVVGKRTWGGVIGIHPRHRLADYSIVTQPEFAFWFSDVGWGVENHGTDPTHDVDISPQDYAANKDPQMDLALDLMKAALKERPPKLPGFGGRPRLALPSAKRSGRRRRPGRR